MKSVFFTLSLGLFFIPGIVFADGSEVEVVLFGHEGEIVSQFHPFGDEYRGTLSMAAEDLGDDGVEELIIASGPGLEPTVKIYRQDGSRINEFIAYMPTYQHGVTVAACDLEGDGTKEIVTGTMQGGGPHIRIFSAEGTVRYGGGFFAYADDFRGGVNVACGDVDGDGKDDIVTGAGLTGGPHVKVFSPYGHQKTEVFAGSAQENTGVSIATGDLNGDGDDEIITGRMGGGDPTVIAFDYKKGRLSFIIALHAFDDYKNGIRVSSGDVDGDGHDEIGVTTSKHETGIVKFFELTGAVATEQSPFVSQLEKGLIATTANNGGVDLLLAASSSAGSYDQIGKYVHVDVSEQTLRAYDNGILVNEFLVSTGTYAFPTPLGKTEVTAKLPVHRYTWSYGPENPNNYDLPGVKWNLRFRRHYYIHSAYWHNNFGNRMSHGCVNAPMEEAEWIFNWADVGTVVEVTE